MFQNTCYTYRLGQGSKLFLIEAKKYCTTNWELFVTPISIKRGWRGFVSFCTVKKNYMRHKNFVLLILRLLSSHPSKEKICATYFCQVDHLKCCLNGTACDAHKYKIFLLFSSCALLKQVQLNGCVGWFVMQLIIINWFSSP